MKIQKFNEIKLNEGLKVNPSTLMLYGEYDLNEVLNELQSLYDEDDIKIPGTIFSLNIELELFHILKELTNWKKEGWNGIKGYGSEWIPLYTSPKKINLKINI
ncbi:MAG: hypothetical protein HPY57_14560 [Ignavibacteria bacterium]|nr:hypothetical protein [Ignavibacteria bacterium]